MRLHAHHDHQDYHLVSRHAKVLLDGAEVRLCIHADEEAGVVERCKMDAAGRLVVEGDCVATETLRGDVCISVPDEYMHLLQEFPFGPIEVDK